MVNFYKDLYNVHLSSLEQDDWRKSMEGVNPFELNTPEWNDAQFEIEHGYKASDTPTTLKQAREIGYFGPLLRNASESDSFIKRMFESKGLTEEQGVQAAIKGAQAHQERFRGGYDAGSSLSGIFNDFIFPAAGVSGIDLLENIPGWTRNDANLRGQAAANREHGGDFGSATGLGQILSYQSNLGGNIWEAWQKDPERPFLGINTPFESSVWGKVTGKDYEPTVDMQGFSTKKDSQTASEKGIDTSGGEWFNQIGRTVAKALGGQALSGVLSGGEAGGEVSGSSGSASMIGDAGSDTLNEGNGMWDWLDGLDTDVGYDPGASSAYNAPLAEDTSTGAFDQYGMNNPTTGFPDQSFDPGGSWLDSLKQYGQQGMDVYNKLKSIPGLSSILSKMVGSEDSKKSTGRGILDSIFSDPLGSTFNATPFLLAMAEAERQGNRTDPILARISGLSDEAAGNQTGLLSSVTGPYNRQTMAGRDALLTDQSLRGIRGSSFGDQGLTSYDTMRDQGLGELTGSTTAKSIGLRGTLLDAMLKGQTQAATSRNLLLGAGLGASGKLFQPQQDPFGLQTLLALTNK